MSSAIPEKYAGHLVKGKGKTRVHLFYCKAFDVLFASFFGGRPHLGAASAALDSFKKRFSGTVKLPGHRDDVVTKKALSILATNHHRLVVTLAGIHYDRAAAPEIRSIVKNAAWLSRKLATDILHS